MTHEDRVEELAEALRTISEQLNDVAMDALREAVENQTGERPAIEKKVSAARRAVDKAVRTLSPDRF